VRARRRAHLGQIATPHSLPPISVRIVEACELTGICRSKLYELNKAGLLPFRKIGSATIVAYEDLRMLVDSGVPKANSVEAGVGHLTPEIEKACLPNVTSLHRAKRLRETKKGNSRQGSLFDLQ
jgi:Helix-turn-helix domain